MPHTFIFFACPKKTNQKKGHFFKGIFATQNQKIINYFSELFSFKMALISSSESPVMLDNMPIDKPFLKPSIATF
jgi:hypothetical protein